LGDLIVGDMSVGDRGGATPVPHLHGAAASGDGGTSTVLADNGIGGLQVRQRSGEWTDVVIPEGTSSSASAA
jgi:isopenicillin N synthase-like dioxygenase